MVVAAPWLPRPLSWFFGWMFHSDSVNTLLPVVMSELRRMLLSLVMHAPFASFQHEPGSSPTSPMMSTTLPLNSSVIASSPLCMTA